MVGELVGARLRGENLRAEEIWTSGQDDLRNISEEELKESWPQCEKMVESHWGRYRSLTDDLRQQGTLYGGEVNYVVLLSRCEDDYISTLLDQAIAAYREERQSATPPRDWLMGASAQFPAGPWYEDIDTWYARKNCYWVKTLSELVDRLQSG